MTAVLTKRGVEIKINDVVAKIGLGEFNKLKNRFKIRYEVYGGRFLFLDYLLIDKVAGVVVFPRMAAFVLLKNNILTSIENRLAVVKKMSTDKFMFTGNLHQNQTVIVNHLIKEIYNPAKIETGTAGCTLQLSPGQGKTFVGIGLIHKLRYPTCIIVPNTLLLNQWMQALTTAFPNLKIGQYNFNYKNEGDIMLVIVNSGLSGGFTFRYKVEGQRAFDSKTLNSSSFYDKFGLIIYDEIHMYCSKDFQMIFTKAQARCVLGLSATPNRLDNFDRIFKSHTGKVVNAETDIKEFKPDNIKFTGKVTVVRYNGPIRFTSNIINEKTEAISCSQMIAQFIRDPYRNYLIALETKRLFDQGHFVFVFSERRKHLTILRDIMISMNLHVYIPEICFDDPDDPEDKVGIDVQDKEDINNDNDVQDKEDIPAVIVLDEPINQDNQLPKKARGRPKKDITVKQQKIEKIETPKMDIPEILKPEPAPIKKRGRPKKVIPQLERVQQVEPVPVPVATPATEPTANIKPVEIAPIPMPILQIPTVPLPMLKEPAMPTIRNKKIDPMALMGGATDEEITHAKEKTRIILTTYMYSSVGVSIDKMTALVLATGRRNNMKQISGRIFRRGGDHTVKRELIDIVDNRTSLKSQVYDRKVVYKENLYEIESKTVNYNDLPFVNSLLNLCLDFIYTKPQLKALLFSYPVDLIAFALA